MNSTPFVIKWVDFIYRTWPKNSQTIFYGRVMMKRFQRYLFTWVKRKKSSSHAKTTMKTRLLIQKCRALDELTELSLLWHDWHVSLHPLSVKRSKKYFETLIICSSCFLPFHVIVFFYTYPATIPTKFSALDTKYQMTFCFFFLLLRIICRKWTGKHLTSSTSKWKVTYSLQLKFYFYAIQSNDSMSILLDSSVF